MNRRWEVAFKVNGVYIWELDAASETEARTEAANRFRQSPFWSERYPTLPASTVRELPPSDAGPAHADIGPFYTELSKGAALPVQCPDCGGELRADHYFVLRSKTLDQPEVREAFWSAWCQSCRHGFNYVPESEDLQRFHP